MLSKGFGRRRPLNRDTGWAASCTPVALMEAGSITPNSPASSTTSRGASKCLLLPKAGGAPRKARHSGKRFPQGDTNPGRETEGADGGPHIFTSNPPRIKAPTVRHQSPKRHIRRLFLGGNAEHINKERIRASAPLPRELGPDSLLS